MSTYLTPPGAWLSGWSRLAQGGLTPIDSRRAQNAAATPIDGNSAATPIDIRGQSAATPIDDWSRRVPQPTQAPLPLPWEGVDPQWVYGNASALLGQALRKSRAKTVRPADDRLTPQLLKDAQLRGKPVNGTHLWRWAPEFRHAQLVGAVLGRFQVHGRALWMLDPGRGGAPSAVRATKVLEFQVPQQPGFWEDQLDKVLRAAVEREDRMPEVLSQASDIWPFFESVIGFRRAALPRTDELLNIAHDAALHLTMGLKHGVHQQRPLHLSSRVMPLVATPAHGSLPSGHATLATLTSVMISGLLYSARGQSTYLQERQWQLDRLARRIAFNRVVAGVHFPADSVAGYALGVQLAQLVLHMGGARVKAPRPMTAADVWAIGRKDTTLDELGVPWPGGPRTRPAGKPVVVSPLLPLQTLCKAAVQELWEAGA